MQSEIAVREFDSITSELRQLSMMSSKFAEFDVAGKQMYLEKVRLPTVLCALCALSALSALCTLCRCACCAC